MSEERKNFDGDPMWAELARHTRDRQWRFAELVAEHGTLWFCPWDKARRHVEPADDVYITGLAGGMGMFEWLHSHPEWWIIGEWSEERYAHPVHLTEAGRKALANREIYDMEPVTGGLVEPGWQATPAARQTEASPDAAKEGE